MKINKKAGFWLRLLVRLIDLFIFLFFISISIFFSTSKVNNFYLFDPEWLFYLWVSTSAFLMLFLTTLMPIITGGKTIGNFLTRTKVISKQKKWKAIIYRELFFGLSWTIIILSFMILLGPKIFVSTITSGPNKIILNSFDEFKFAFLSTFSGVVIFAQFILCISLLIKKDRYSLIDSFSKSDVVRVNKFVHKQKKELEITIKPRLVKKALVEWVEGKNV